MKVTDLCVIVFVMAAMSCRQVDVTESQLDYQQKLDSLASVQIDSIYRMTTQQCDTLKKYKVPYLVDSLLKLDTPTNYINEKK